MPVHKPIHTKTKSTKIHVSVSATMEIHIFCLLAFWRAEMFIALKIKGGLYIEKIDPKIYKPNNSRGKILQSSVVKQKILAYHLKMLNQFSIILSHYNRKLI